MSVHYTAFGEMAVEVEGVRHPLTRRRERDVLSVLLAAQGAPVAAERLLVEVWGDESPGQTLASLQVVVSRLRRLLEPDRAARKGTRLVSTAAGYALRAEVADVDTWHFESDANAALEAAAPADRLVLSDAAHQAVVQHEVTRLVEREQQLLEAHAQALLDLGRPEEALRALADLTGRHPYRERVWGQLALAQYQSSRQADALATLRTLRERLADELGVDPSEEIQLLEQAVLRQDQSVAAAPSTGTLAKRPASVPAPTGPAPSTAESAAVGRAAVVEHLLQSHRESAAQGRTAFVLVAGEAGIGKSRLVSDVMSAAEVEGTRVLVGRCLEGEYAPALWPWLELVRHLAEDHPVDPLLTSLLAGEPTDRTGGAGAALRMFDAVVGLLVTAAEQQPLLVVLEDLHWADATSLLLLRHLAGSEVSAPLTIIGTRRTMGEPTSEALVDTMATLARAGAERIRLDGLAVADVRILLEGAVGPHDARLDDVVAEMTAGNPFFVLQYARLLAARPDLRQLEPSELPVPDGVRDVLRQRVARLPDDAGRLLVSASVLGRIVEPDLLAELTATSADECLDALDLALTSGLVEERQAAYAFVHALARETLYAELSTARRMRLHDQAGRLVERDRSTEVDAAAEIAHHAHVAAPLGREHADRACAWLARAAGVAESRHAHPEALALWQQVLVDAEQGSPTAARGHRGAAAALMRLGRLREAHESLEAALRIARGHEDWSLVAEAAAVLSGAGPWSWSEHGSENEHLVEVLTEAVGHVEPRLQARLLAVLQLEHFYAWRSPIVTEYGRRAVVLARETGDVELQREVITLRLIASSGSWDAEERLTLGEELLELEPTGDLRVSALFHLAQARWHSFDTEGADETIRRCAEAASELRHSGIDIPLGWWRAARARDRDDPGHDRLIDEVLDLHRRGGYHSSTELQCLHSVRRSPVGAPVPDATVVMAQQGGMAVRALVAHALLESGRPDTAHSLLGDPLGDEVTDYSANAGRALRLLVLAETGTEAEVRAALAPLEGHVGAPVSYGSIDHLGVVDHFVAAAYAALGDARAAETARTAVELNRRLGVAPWVRRSEELLARLS